MRHSILGTAAILAACTLGSSLECTAQWTDHFSYAGCTHSAAVGNVAVCGNATGLFYFDPAENYLGHLGLDNHLSSTSVSALFADGDRLVVGYTDGNIDIVDLAEHSTTNIPELRLADNVSQQAIHGFVRSGNRYYAAFGSGILEIDRRKNEIRSLWKVAGAGLDVRSVCLHNDTLYAATAVGIYCARASSNTLEDSRQWALRAQPDSSILALAATPHGVVAAKDLGGGKAELWLMGADSTYLCQSVSNFRSLLPTADGLLLARRSAVDILSADGQTIRTINKITAPDSDTNLLTYAQSASMLQDGRLAVADNNNGLLICSPNGTNAQVHKPNGPHSNDLTSLASGGGEIIYATGAGRNSSYNNTNNPVSVSIFNNSGWSSITATNPYGKDPIYVAANPLNPSEAFISTWGTGIYRIADGQFTDNYGPNNSSLTDIFGGTGYVRTDALAFDRKGNLYVANCGNKKSINVRTADGEWFGYTYGDFEGWHSNAGLIVTRNNNVWLYGSRMANGVVIYNINGTPDDPSDDGYFTSKDWKKEQQWAGKISLNETETGDDMGGRFTALAEDREGIIWIGTPVGLLTCANDRRLWSNGGPILARVKVPRNDGSGLADYLLDGLNITTIAVDGANRKWIGTAADGVYLVSANGYELIHHFTTEDSPLMSNTVKSIAIRHKSADVFILTDKGLQSYHSDATEPVEKIGTLTVYPNPASLNRSQGYVNIDGLEEGSHVFITDAAGNRVFYAVSKGGLTRWNLTRNGGAKVTPGVYIVWASNADGSNKKMTKILVED